MESTGGAQSSVSNLKAMFEKNIQKQQDQIPTRKSGTVAFPKKQTQNPEVNLVSQQQKEEPKDDKSDVKSSVNDLKSVFEKKTTPLPGPNKGVPPSRNAGDSGWIKNSKTMDQKATTPLEKKEQPPVVQNPIKKVEVEQPKVEPKPLQSNPFAKSAAGEISINKNEIVSSQPKQETVIQSSKQQQQDPVIISIKKEEEKKPVVKEEEVVRSSVVQQNKPQEVPKKLVVNNIFNAQPKANEFPIKKAQDPPKKLQQQEIVQKDDKPIQSNVQAQQEPPKKLIQNNPFGQTSKPAQEPMKEPPKKLQNPFADKKPSPSPFPPSQKKEPVVSSVKKNESNEALSQADLKKQQEDERVRKLFGDDDDDEDDVKLAPGKSAEPQKQVQQQPLPQPKKETFQQPLPQKKAEIEQPPKLVDEEAKNSLAALLSRGNPLMPGVQRKQTVTKQRVEEEELPKKELIKFDIFNEDEGPTNQPKTVLNNDDALSKPTVMKSKQATKKYDFFDDDDF